jgi:hypothetical protein
MIRASIKGISKPARFLLRFETAGVLEERNDRLLFSIYSLNIKG